MKKVGFIGGADKTNLIMYIAKTLDDIGKKVLVVDTTSMQKMKYILPAINPTKSYITDFENTDYAIGFQNVEDIAKYLGLGEDINSWPYDYLLLDIDDISALEQFEIEDTGDNFFVTSFDMYSLKKGVEVLKHLPTKMTLSKILINYDIKTEDEEYLDFLTIDTQVAWDDFVIYLPIMRDNEEAMNENQRVYKARLKRLAIDYQDAIIYIVQNIVKDMNTSKIKKSIRS